MLTKTVRLVDMINPIQINFNGIDYYNEFFYSLFLKIILTENLLNVHNISKNIFKHYQGNYKPHLSLAYGNYKKREKKEMLDIIGPTPVWYFAKKLCLAKNDEKTLNWEIIKSFNINK